MSDTPSLPLTPFERYMLADDQPGFPMVSVLRMDFGGELDAQLLVDALPPALVRHPLLCARVRGNGLDAQWHWDDSAPIEEVLRFVRDEEDSSTGDVPLNLTRTGGLRILVRKAAEGTRVTLRLHHAVADGVGCMQFIADWLANYESLYRGLPVQPAPPVASDGLLGRGNSRWIIAEPVTRWMKFKSYFVDTARWLTRRPQVLRGTTTPSPSARSSCDLLHATLTAEETQQLRKLASRHRATLNDVLLRDLFLTLCRWQGNGWSLGRKWLRINMPQNLRLSHEPLMPACNVIGYAFLTRKTGDCKNPARLLDDISQETAAVRRWNLGQLFLDGLGSAERLPGVVRWFTKSRRSMATTVLSNLGDVRRFFRHALPRRDRWFTAGDVPLLRLLAAPPVRPGTHAVFLASTCADELTISFRAHPAHVTAQEQSELLALYAQTLRQTAAQANREGELNREAAATEHSVGQPALR